MTPVASKAHHKKLPSIKIDCYSEVPQVKRRSCSSALKRYLLPCALCSLACLLAAVLMVAGTRGTWALMRGASDLKRHNATASPDAADGTSIQQLQRTAQQNHEEVLELLFDIKMGQQVQKVPIVPHEQLVSFSNPADTGSAADYDESAEAEPSTATAAAQETGWEVEMEEAEVPAALSALPLLTTLHNNILRHSQEFHRHRSVVQQILNQLVHMPAAAAEAEVQDRLDSGSLEPVELFTFELYRLMLASGKLIPCREDSTLVVGDTISLHDDAKGSSSSKKPRTDISSSSSEKQDSRSHSSSSSSSLSDTTAFRYYFATNLRDNSIQMPHYTLSLLQTLLRLPRDSVFVSVYESNSDDGMHGWIDVLQLALDVIGTHNRVVTRGMLVRTGEQDRIQFLAQVRNMAMAPLYSHYGQQQPKLATDTKDYPHSSTGVDINSTSSAGPGALPWDPDYIVFINDVYFCSSMVLRLMNYRADITCGTDWNQFSGNTDSLPPDSPERNKDFRSKPQLPPELELEAPIPEPLAPDQENPINFYDTWVARDIAGGKFGWGYPYIMDKNSSSVLQQGLPVRASCCWNGLAVLRAEPFKRGVRFRMHQKGECRASECTLMCDDFARLGYKEVVVDTGVQLAYDYDLAREIIAVGIEGVGLSTWAQVKAAGILQAHREPDYQRMECCAKRPGENQVRFNTDCRRRNIMRRNYTLSALQMSQAEWAI